MKRLTPDDWLSTWYHYSSMFSEFTSCTTLRRREIILLASLNTSKQEDITYGYIRELMRIVLEKYNEKYKHEYFDENC